MMMSNKIINLKKIFICLFIICLFFLITSLNDTFAIENGFRNIKITKLKVLKPRQEQNGILLPTGEVLITGGIQQEPYVFGEIYNPKTNTFREPKGNIKYGEVGGQRVLMNDMQNHASVILNNGDVFLVGGYRCTPTIYNYKTETFNKIENAPTNFGHNVSMKKLKDGSVLIVDEYKSYRFYPDKMEFYKLEFCDDIVKNGKNRALIELEDGDILIFGNGTRNRNQKNINNNSGIDFSRIYKFNINANKFSYIGNLKNGRVDKVQAKKIDSENILVWGGLNKNNNPVKTIEKYNVRTNTSQIICTLTNTNPSYNIELNNENIIIGTVRWEGYNEDYSAIEVFNIKTNQSYIINNKIPLYLPYRFIKLEDNSILILCGSQYKKHSLSNFSEYAYRLQF